ncbi:MAG: methyltransferase domain-containing protein [Fibrobacteres bacterium]|nr:methyltransferase domain-containing protein [Fibrobacterota bacterium]
MKIKTFLTYFRPRYFLTSRRGHCPMCGKATLFFMNDTPETIRNHALCVRCGCCSRHRHLALSVQREFAARGIRSLSDFRAYPELSVLNASTGTPVARFLGAGPNIICSEYFDDTPPGAIKGGIRNEDLGNLSMPDNSLDLVVTEDVFEHIPAWKLAFGEVHRVLKPGGCHIFTIPYYFNRKTRELFQWEGDKPVLTEPVEYHGDPIRGSIPAFLHFGRDLPDILEGMGFETRIEITSFAECERYGTWDSFTLVSRKSSVPAPSGSQAAGVGAARAGRTSHELRLNKYFRQLK